MTERKVLIGIDPGKMTGITVLDYTIPEDISIIYQDELDVVGFMTYIRDIPQLFSGDRVSIIYESFIITTETGKKTQQHFSLELIGVIKYLCWVNGYSMESSKPSDKAFGTNDKLRRSGLWYVGGEGHANDSARHALRWLVRKFPRQMSHVLVD